MNLKPRVGFRWKQAVGLLCLSAYLFGGAKIVPALLAVAAEIEGSHKVLIGCSTSAFDVRLHHNGGAGAGCVNHKHGLASKMFCVLASSQSSDPDHVLHFASGFASEGPSAELALSSGAAFSIEPIEASLWSVCSIQTERISMKTHPPPRAPGHLSELRVTVLVI